MLSFITYLTGDALLACLIFPLFFDGECQDWSEELYTKNKRKTKKKEFGGMSILLYNMRPELII